MTQASTRGRWLAALALAGSAALLAPGSAQAVPSFARQTGMACEACHTVFPELTPFGRRFKLNGYTIDNLPQVSSMNVDKQATLSLNQLPPLSFMFQTSYTSTRKAVPDSNAGNPNVPNVPADALAKNGQVLFPQQASLFYAGRIAPNFGAFVQMTYDGTSGSFGWDNTDIRYSVPVSDQLLLGVSMNNNPTVQDLWNSTPAWQSPFDQLSATAPQPGAVTQVDGPLAQLVAGISAYASWADSVYAELGFYRAAPSALIVDSSVANVVNGNAPYYRLAFERQWGRHSWEVGLYGLNVDEYPGNGSPLSGPTNRFRDIALDTQYQFIGDQHLFSVQATYIDEKQNLDASFAAGNSQNASDTLKTWRLGGSYYYQRKYGGEIGWFSTTGSSDSGLYQAGTLTGFANNSPDSDGWRLQLDWVPYENTKFALQYTIYGKYNGGSSNYDGQGRNAHDNNTLYLLGWINF